MALEQEIREAIDADLPNQIGQRLKTRLERADADELALEAATEELKSVQAENVMLRERERQLDNLEGREEAIVATEREQMHRGAILEEQEKMTNVRCGDMMNILQTVFKGPISGPVAFNANLYGNVTDANGMNRNANLSGDVTQKDA